MPSTRHFSRSLFIQANNKSELRTHFRAIRARIPADYQQSAAHAATRIFIQQEVFRQSEHIACYICYKHEFDAAPMMEAIWQANKKCYLPALTEEKTLRFIQYHKGDALQKNRYSILEPVNVSHEISADELDIVIVPLLAF